MSNLIVIHNAKQLTTGIEVIKKIICVVNIFLSMLTTALQKKKQKKTCYRRHKRCSQISDKKIFIKNKPTKYFLFYNTCKL
jgi:hypothetical protein